MKQRARGFTLIEILIVLAIIAILMALLFPAFKRAEESSHQASCATNLHEIYVALQLYRNDERRYPASLAFLLPNDFTLNNVTGASSATNSNGTGYLKSANQYLLCPDDDTQSTTPRTSYGDVSTGLQSVLPPYDPTTPTNTDASQFVWNWFGYQSSSAIGPNGAPIGPDGTAYTTAPSSPPSALLVDPTNAYNLRTNPINYSLSNRFAPSGTIITHCIYHRLPTSSVSDNRSLYTEPAADGTGALDLILRLDGTAKVYEVASFNQVGSSGYAPWQQQNF